MEYCTGSGGAWWSQSALGWFWEIVQYCNERIVHLPPGPGQKIIYYFLQVTKELWNSALVSRVINSILRCIWGVVQYHSKRILHYSFLAMTYPYDGKGPKTNL